MIGYVLTTHEFFLQKSDARFRVKLPEDNVMLNTVEISAMSWAERKRHLETFIRCFLGSSKNAAQCKIVNTDDIKLRFDKVNYELTASSNDFLIIENKALGYRMKYLLNNFLYDRSIMGNNFISFNGTLFFEDMKGNARQLKKWEEERANTYLGSVQHYFRSVFSDTREENGFITYIMPNSKAWNNMAMKNPDLLRKYITPVTNSFKKYINEVDDNFKTINLGLLQKDSTELFVLYTGKKEPQDFIERGNVIVRRFKMHAGQLSIVSPTHHSVLISRYGDIGTTNAMTFAGFWAFGQMSSFLPSDYVLPADVKLPKEKTLSQPAGQISIKKAEE